MGGNVSGLVCGIVLPPLVSLFLFFLQTNIDKVVFNQTENTGEYNQHEIQGDTINMRIFKWVITRYKLIAIKL